MQIFVMIRELN